MKLLWGHFVVSSFSLWTPGFNSWPAGIRFMVYKGVLVQVFLQGLCICWVSIVQPVLHIHSAVSDTAYCCQHDISLRKTEVFMCGYQKCGVRWRKFCGIWRESCEMEVSGNEHFELQVIEYICGNDGGHFQYLLVWYLHIS